MTDMGSAKATNRVRTGPCTNYRVVELSSMVTAPLCGQILGDLGADVIKVEPIGGDVMRTIPPTYNGHSAAFAQWNRNKRSIALDLKTAEGIEIVRRMVRGADVFMQNMRAGISESLGLGYKELARVNPEIIYLELTGYGPDGPYRDQPGYDMIVQGLTGFMPVQGDANRPQPVRAIQADKITGYTSAMAIMAALLHRANGGGGQQIGTNILDSYATFMLPEMLYGTSFADAPPSNGDVMGIYNTVKVRDGFVIGFIMTEDQFSAACKHFGTPQLREDPRFQTAASRNVHQVELMAEIEAKCSQMTIAEVIKLARENGIPFAPVNDIDAFMRDEQARHNETFVEFDTEEVGRVKLMNGFAHFSKTPINAKSLAPQLGANTDDILIEHGFNQEEIQSYRRRGIVG
ncbi:CoA transferase [Sphingomonadaceae bacterium G21617-S1]|nr:CoA transferase [Sphingomonadaceae bacterium G21617-S1]